MFSKRRMFLIIASVLLIMMPFVFADVDHGGADWNITANINASDYHFNIRDLWIQPGVNVTIIAYNSTNASTGWLKINATRNAYVYGSIIGDGRGYAGGSGGGGGGGGTGNFGDTKPAGNGGQNTDGGGQDGVSGQQGSYNDGGDGGYGGNSSTNLIYGAGGLHQPGENVEGLPGKNGTSAPSNNDTSITINASMGLGGAGGGGGAGATSYDVFGAYGGGGGAGGPGGDGGSYLIVIARQSFISNGSFLMRAGQSNCSATAASSFTGGNGGSNNRTNCGSSNGSIGGQGFTGPNGAIGGNGGAGAGGMIVIAASSMNLSGSNLNATGNAPNATGTIKILYRSAVLSNGTYDGAIVYSNISDAWFIQSISWNGTVTNVSISWNTSFYLDLNGTNSSDCNVSVFLSNNTHFPINASTGVINTSANISKVGLYSLLISLNDTCSNIITQTIQVNITYIPINLTEVSISPSPTGTSNPLVCLLIINNTENSNITNTTRWYKNNTLQAALENRTTIAVGNLTLADEWICSAQIKDSITIGSFVNSSMLVLGDITVPSINSLSIQSSGSSSTPITIYLNCTDDNDLGVGFPKAQWTNPNSAIEGNFTMSLNGATGLYEKSYTYTIPGTYSNFTFYCADGSGNLNTTYSSINLVISAAGQATVGGGGGLPDLPTTSEANFEVTPIAKKVTAYVGIHNIEEFQIVNKGEKDIQVNITVHTAQSDQIGFKFIDFEKTKQKITAVVIPASTGLLSGTSYIRYSIVPPSGTTPGTYYVTFDVTSGSVVKTHTVTMTVQSNIFSPIIALWNIEIFSVQMPCASAFEEDQTCQSSSFSLKLGTAFVIILLSLFVIYVAKNLKRRGAYNG